MDEKLDQRFAENNAKLREELRLEFNLSFSRIEHSLAKLDGRLSRVENDVRDVRLDLENNIRPQIRLLAEVYVPKAQDFERTASFS